MKRSLIVLLLLIAVGCGEDFVPTAPPIPEPPSISGAWRGIVTSSALPDGVWTMTLGQEGVAIAGTWSDNANGIDGTVSASVDTAGVIIGVISVNVRTTPLAIPTCSTVNTLRGTVLSPSHMTWTTLGSAAVCAGAPGPAQMDWSRSR